LPDIFLSYNREDRARAKVFAEAFRAEGFDVWWDVGLQSGDAYDEVTEGALRASKAVVVLWSARSVQSRWVKSEATLADKAKKLAPAMIEACERPIMFELVQTADLISWKGDRGDARWTAFVADVRRLVEADGVRRPDAAPLPAAKARPSRRRVVLIGAAAGTVGVAAAGAALWPKGPARKAGEATLAVMPFDNLSLEPGNAFMADGLAEEILNGLQRVKGLRVIARTSSFALREETLTAQEIGTRLGADVLIQGSVRQSGKDLRVTAQIIDAKSGEQRYSETFPQTVDNLFALQDAVTAAVVRELPKVVGVARLAAPVVARPPVDPETFRNMLEANDLWSRAANLRQVGRQDEADALFAQIKGILEAELRKDPENGDALTMQASLMITRANPLFAVGTPRQDLQTCKAILARVLANDPYNVEACTLQAEIFSRFDYRWQEAEELLLRALSVNSNSANTYTQLGYHYAKVGRAVEAVPQAEIGYKLDPQSVFRRSSVARVLPAAGRADEGIAIFRDIAFAGETNIIGARDLFYALMERGDTAGMTDVARRLEPMRHLIGIDDFIKRMLAVREGMQGRPEQHREIAAAFFARTTADQLWQNQTLWFLTVEAAAMGDIDRALDGFELCIRYETLYQPQWAPYGAPVPEALAKHPRWMAIWTADPRLKELCDLRLEALERRQFQGRLPDGTMVTPA
jgi:TolB-like protein